MIGKNLQMQVMQHKILNVTSQQGKLLPRDGLEHEIESVQHVRHEARRFDEMRQKSQQLKSEANVRSATKLGPSL